MDKIISAILRSVVWIVLMFLSIVAIGIFIVTVIIIIFVYVKIQTEIGG